MLRLVRSAQGIAVPVLLPNTLILERLPMKVLLAKGAALDMQTSCMMRSIEIVGTIHLEK